MDRFRSWMLGLAGVALVGLAGCASTTPTSDFRSDQHVPDGLYVDWDRADWLLDRYIMVNIRDYTTAQNLGRRKPAEDYQKAITYSAEWDSLGLIPFLSLVESEQTERRRLARNHLAEARRVALDPVQRYRMDASRGYLPNLNAVDNAPIPVGAETAVSSAISHLVRATGLDPSHVAAWRDLAYFFGVVGDRQRQQRALTAALAAMDQVDPIQSTQGDLARLRRDIFLDLAWLARDIGQPVLTLAYLDHAAPWIRADSPEQADRRLESKILRGLALADQGEWLAAMEQARDIPRYAVLRRTLRGGVREDLRWHLSPPNFEAMGYDRGAWPRQESDFGRRWIKAVAGAPSGDMEHTIWLLGAPPTDLEFPSRLAWRFWQDQGLLYARAGDQATAQHCFTWAAMYRPYMAFFPLAGTEPAQRLGTADRPQRYYTGYGLFFICGDRRAYDRDVSQTALAGRMP